MDTKGDVPVDSSAATGAPKLAEDRRRTGGRVLSRRTILAIARLATACFEYSVRVGSRGQLVTRARVDLFADLLFEKGFDHAIVDSARAIFDEAGAIQTFVLHLSRGALSRGADDGAVAATFVRLAASLLDYGQRPEEQTHFRIPPTPTRDLLSALELDGYTLRDGELISSEDETTGAAERSESGALSLEQEAVLSVLHRGNAPMDPKRLARECDHNLETSSSLVGDLKRLRLVGLVPGTTAYGHDGTVILTVGGEKAARALVVGLGNGRVAEFDVGLDEGQHLVLDTAVSRQLEVCGGNGWTEGAALRATLREYFGEVTAPPPDVVLADLVASGHLRASGDPDPRYGLGLRGLLCSRWGADAMGVIEGSWQFLDAEIKAHRSIKDYSWRSLRQHAGIPQKAFALVHLGLELAGLSSVCHSVREDPRWGPPLKLDTMIYGNTAVEHVRGLLERVEPPPAPTHAEGTRDVEDEGLLADELAVPEEHEVRRRAALEDIERVLDHKVVHAGTPGVTEVATLIQACITRLTAAGSHYRGLADRINPFPEPGQDARTAQQAGALMRAFRSDVAAGRIDLVAIHDGGRERNTMPMNKKVFVVHGHDEAAKHAVENLLHRLKLEPVVLHREANKGRTIIEKLEQEAAPASYAIVLLTPDDEARKAGDPASLTGRARQNVIFEWGLFVGKLKRANVCALSKGVEVPSDLHGVIWIPMDGGWEAKLAKEMQEAGVPFDPRDAL